MDPNNVSLSKGDKVTLIKNDNGINSPININDTFKVNQGISNSYEFSTSMEDKNDKGKDKKLVATLKDKKINNNQKAVLEGGISSSLVLASSNEAIGNNINDVSTKLSGSGNNITSSAGIGGSDTRSKTGSHVDMKSVNLIASIAKKLNDSFIYGAFFESGFGSYDSYNSFSSGDVKGSGDSSYFGFGLFSKSEFIDNYYFENSIRVGQVKADFSSNDFGNGINKISSSFDSKRAYYGAHLGVGKIIDINDVSNIDIYTKAYYTRISSEDITMSTKDQYKFDSIDSFVAKLGARYNYELKDSISLYGGASIQREFDNKANGYNMSYNYRLDAPSMKGNTGIFEAGIKIKPISNKLTMDIGAQGLVGKSEGISSKLGFEWRL